MQPLYCWFVDKNLTKVTKYEITDYTKSMIYKSFEYRFKHTFGSNNSSIYILHERNLDKLCNRKYYSFNNDDSLAYKNMIKDAEASYKENLIRCNNAQNLLLSLKSVIESIKKGEIHE